METKKFGSYARIDLIPLKEEFAEYDGRLTCNGIQGIGKMTQLFSFCFVPRMLSFW